MELEAEEVSRLSSICHELRGATWVIRGFLELLDTNWSTYDEDKRQELVKMAYENAQRVERVLKDLDDWRAPAREAAPNTSGLPFS